MRSTLLALCLLATPAIADDARPTKLHRYGSLKHVNERPVMHTGGEVWQPMRDRNADLAACGGYEAKLITADFRVDTSGVTTLELRAADGRTEIRAELETCIRAALGTVSYAARKRASVVKFVLVYDRP